jgi:hypothetical protein
MNWNWKNILALAVFVLPMAYCEAINAKALAEIRIACISAGGEWRNTWGGTCVFNNKQNNN